MDKPIKKYYADYIPEPQGSIPTPTSNVLKSNGRLLCGNNNIVHYWCIDTSLGKHPYLECYTQNPWNYGDVHNLAITESLGTYWYNTNQPIPLQLEFRLIAAPYHEPRFKADKPHKYFIKGLVITNFELRKYEVEYGPKNYNTAAIYKALE